MVGTTNPTMNGDEYIALEYYTFGFWTNLATKRGRSRSRSPRRKARDGSERERRHKHDERSKDDSHRSRRSHLSPSGRGLSPTDHARDKRAGSSRHARGNESENKSRHERRDPRHERRGRSRDRVCRIILLSIKSRSIGQFIPSIEPKSTTAEGTGSILFCVFNIHHFPRP